MLVIGEFLREDDERCVCVPLVIEELGMALSDDTLEIRRADLDSEFVSHPVEGLDELVRNASVHQMSADPARLDADRERGHNESPTEKFGEVLSMRRERQILELLGESREVEMASALINLDDAPLDEQVRVDDPVLRHDYPTSAGAGGMS